MTALDLLRCGRENLVHTYLRLGEKVPQAEVERRFGVTSCRSRLNLPFGNFALDIRTEEPDACLSYLGRLARETTSFRVFSLPDDEPPDFALRLERAGFRPSLRLAQMAADGREGAPAEEAGRAREPLERWFVSQFMVRQFFWRSHRELQEQIVAVTAASEHELWYVGDVRHPIAAVMVTRTPGTLGLYNLCVAPEHRRRGIGGRLVELVRSAAAREGRVVALQCEPGLVPWYEMRGFCVMGKIGFYGLDRP